MTDHKNVYMALAAAQTQMGKAIKDTKNDHFRSKYADLSSVMDACMGALTANGIAVFQPTGTDDRGDYVETVLFHGASETSVSCKVPLILGKRDMQGYGSAVTYARRYGLMSMAGIAPEDDDGNAAAASAPKGKNHMTEALVQARDDAVEDAAPANATPRQKAEAGVGLMIQEFKSKTGVKALNAAWDKWADRIVWLEEHMPDLREKVGDAFDVRMNEISEAQAAQ